VLTGCFVARNVKRSSGDQFVGARSRSCSRSAAHLVADDQLSTLIGVGDLDRPLDLAPVEVEVVAQPGTDRDLMPAFARGRGTCERADRAVGANAPVLPASRARWASILRCCGQVAGNGVLVLLERLEGKAVILAGQAGSAVGRLAKAQQSVSMRAKARQDQQTGPCFMVCATPRRRQGRDTILGGVRQPPGADDRRCLATPPAQVRISTRLSCRRRKDGVLVALSESPPARSCRCRPPRQGSLEVVARPGCQLEGQASKVRVSCQLVQTIPQGMPPATDGRGSVADVRVHPRPSRGRPSRRV